MKKICRRQKAFLQLQLKGSDLKIGGWQYGKCKENCNGDGEELDCYVLGVFEPLEKFKGKCIAVIHRTNDNDDKLVIVPEEKD